MTKRTLLRRLKSIRRSNRQSFPEIQVTRVSASSHAVRLRLGDLCSVVDCHGVAGKEHPVVTAPGGLCPLFDGEYLWTQGSLERGFGDESPG